MSDQPCPTFSESEAHDECKHCGWTEEAHDAKVSRVVPPEPRAEVIPARYQRMLDELRAELSAARQHQAALIADLRDVLALLESVSAHECSDPEFCLVFRPETMCARCKVKIWLENFKRRSLQKDQPR